MYKRQVFVGVGLFGPVGALIGIPVTAAALAIVDSLRRQHELMPELEALQDDDGDVPTQEEVIELVAEARATIELEEAHQAARSDQVAEVVKDVPAPDVASVATVTSKVIDQQN